jgi:GNAT superfamily N-acetyltransferase
MTVFRDWPYLYQGDAAYERRYLETFLSSPDAALIVAWKDGRAIGMATASPLSGQPSDMTGPLKRVGIEVANAFYFGESVLLPEFRGLGIGHRFFDEREAAARAAHAEIALFCAVDRAPEHPLRPADARDLTPFWRHRGYAPLATAHFQMWWTEIGEAHEAPHRMTFWSRQLLEHG